MSEDTPTSYGTVSLSRQIKAPRQLVYEAWTEIEHRRQWFAGPSWTEINRSLDLKVGGQEIAHGRFENGTETIYTARFHLVEPNARLIYAFDMHVGGKLFSVSLVRVLFEDKGNGTELTYTEQAFFLLEDYGAEARKGGTNGLLDKFESYVKDKFVS